LPVTILAGLAGFRMHRAKQRKEQGKNQESKSRQKEAKKIQGKRTKAKQEKRDATFMPHPLKHDVKRNA
jgi:hypothetical protein